MEQFVERIHTAARECNYKEIKRIVHQLLVIGACDHKRTQEILESIKE